MIGIVLELVLSELQVFSSLLITSECAVGGCLLNLAGLKLD